MLVPYGIKSLLELSLGICISFGRSVAGGGGGGGGVGVRAIWHAHFLWKRFRDTDPVLFSRKFQVGITLLFKNFGF